MNHILIADSDNDFTTLTADYLCAQGYTCDTAHEGETAIKKILNQSFDAVLLEVTLPKKNGFEVLQAIRPHSAVPILMLAESHKSIDCIVALELNADEYWVKPFNPLEFIAQLKAVLRRSQTTPVQRSIIEYQNILVDSKKRLASISGKILDLTNAEFNILEILIKSPDQAFSKEELTEYALGRKYTAFDRSIDVHISNLRSKLGNNASGEEWLKTVRGFGYRFNAEDD